MAEALAIVLEQHGGPEALQLKRVATQAPGRGELLVRQTAIGVNYHDVYVRNGSYRTLALPGIPGIEAVGWVEAVGEDTANFGPGDRIAYVSPEYGAYASLRVLPATRAAKLPDVLGDTDAAGVFMKALTACVLVRHVHAVEAGETILVHAAAGGMGQLLCAWGTALGARVIGAVGSQSKAATAERAGAAATILYREADVAAQVMELTGGAGVAAVYDSVGADTFAASKACLAFGGALISFGQSSGAPPPVALSDLAVRSSSLSRPVVFHFMRSAPQLAALCDETFRAFADGVIKPLPSVVLPLEQAAQAHRLLEGRASPGAIVLTI
jgi:NADPH2:quinone reductase